MKRLAIVSGILALAAPLAFAQTSTWVSDPNHSEVDFGILHMSIAKVHGRFGNVAATIQYNEADVTKSTVQATIDVTTVDTGVQARDTDLKSAGYFDVAGNLTLHGVTKPVVLDVQGPTAPVTDRRNKVHSGFEATTTISRTAFGIAPKMPSAALGDDVELTIEIDAVKQ